MQPEKVEQTGKNSFKILWRDGAIMEYELPFLQKMCPCAKCREGARVVKEDVLVHTIQTKGRYGLVFSFTSGCDRGVYTYSLLRRIGRLVQTS